MSLEGAVISAGNPSGNARPADRRVSALIGHGVAVVDKVVLGDVYTVFSLKQAEVDLGLTAAYDTTNKVAVWYNIKEFYRLAPKGTKLYIMLVDNTLTAGELDLPFADIFEDVDGLYAKKLLLAGGGEIYQIGGMFNPATGYTATNLNGMDADIYAAIGQAQGLYEWADERFMPCNIILEGFGLNGLASAAAAINELAANRVTVCIGQDYDYTDGLDTLGKKHAAVGTALGCVAYAKVSQNIGDCEDISLVISDAKGNFATPGLSDHTKCKDRGDDLDTLDAKGYLFGYNMIGLNGARWNGDPVCAPAEEDSEGILSVASISDGRTLDEIRRRLRARMLPKVRTNQKLDPTTGKLSPGAVQYFNKLGDQVFEEMAAGNEISGGETQVNPDSNLSVQPRILEVGFSYVKIGQIDKIEGKVNIKTSL